MSFNFNYEDLVMQTQRNFSRYYGIYASGKTPFKLSEKAPLSYEKQVESFAEAVRDAECILVGGASGLSAAGGGDFYYTDTPSFYEHFGKFAEKYHFKGAFNGMMVMQNAPREEYWAYLATFLHTTQTAPVRKPYLELDQILEGKDFFILTTNQDTQFTKLYPMDKIAEIQGDHRFFQCSRPCHDEVWDAVGPVEEMIRAMGDGTSIPTEMIPRCPECGAEMFPWVRGYGNLLQGEKYYGEYQKVSEYLDKNKDRKILYLEFGVGRMTPMFIQEPFWNLTFNNPNARYITVNDKLAFLPEQIENQGLAIQGDILKVLTDVRKYMKK